MPWYKSGTVSCTQNSSTITGTNTGFAANARVGDAFLGSDGRWYEVANIASDTVLSILPAYLGATVSAGTYALAPMQGYVKDSADALRALVNKFGTLAASAPLNALAGLTGTAGMVPYFTAADAMALLRITSSQTDSTTGRLLRVGDFGVGAAVSPTCPVTDLNSLQVSGTFRIDTTHTNTPYGAGRAGDLVESLLWNNGGVWYQRYESLEGDMWLRKTTGTWRKIYSQGNVVGTVSQVSGVPTGAVIETGTNSNGRYTKLADGTMTCTILSGPLNIAPGSVYNGPTLTFPAAFASEVRCHLTFSGAYPYDLTGNFESGVSTTACRYSVINRNGANTLTPYLYITATGRWF